MPKQTPAARRPGETPHAGPNPRPPHRDEFPLSLCHEDGGILLEKHEIFAKNLETIRRYRNQSVGEFSREIGIPKSTLQSVRNSGNTTLDTALRIADGLGLPLDSLTSDSRLAEKADLVWYLLQSVDWLRGLSKQEQEEVVYHFQRILEVICQ